MDMDLVFLRLFQVIPESYIQAKREAAEAERQKQQWEDSQQMEEQNYPDSYWEAKKSVAEQGKNNICKIIWNTTAKQCSVIHV